MLLLLTGLFSSIFDMLRKYTIVLCCKYLQEQLLARKTSSSGHETYTPRFACRTLACNKKLGQKPLYSVSESRATSINGLAFIGIMLASMQATATFSKRVGQEPSHQRKVSSKEITKPTVGGDVPFSSARCQNITSTIYVLVIGLHVELEQQFIYEIVGIQRILR